jgi:acetylornithine deacetylase
MNAEEILARLIAFPTVVGTPNGAIVNWIRGYCRAAGADVTVLVGPEGDRSNLFVTVGPREARGYIISRHMDVVPAGEPEWSSDTAITIHGEVDDGRPHSRRNEADCPVSVGGFGRELR